MTEEVKDRKAPKAPKAPRGKMKNVGGSDADKKKAPKNLTWGFWGFYGIVIFSILAGQKMPTCEIKIAPTSPNFIFDQK